MLFLGWGAALRETYVRLNPDEVVPEPSEGEVAVKTLGRRQFLVRLGAATAVITVASGGIGNLLAQAARRELEDELAASMAHLSQGTTKSPFPNAGDPVMPAPGTRPEYTPLKDHYKVFIRIEPTVIDGETWALPISGLVGSMASLTLDDLRNNYEPRDQYVTISCISGRIGTDLISTTQWTGVSLQDILADVKPSKDARYLYISSGDGFYETVDLDLIASDERIMLTYAWDGNPIPIDHGFPLRIWLPDRFGMKQPKWITGIEVMKDYKEGYWVERGWDEVAQVQATSVIDTVAEDAIYESDGRQLVPVGGIAFAGDRQISRVEVRVDGGPWEQARLRAPLSETTWVIWRYDWPFVAGNHEFEVRCAEGDGTPQIEEERGNRPSGARGIHSRNAKL
ncbi:MAG: molybdopterin-dependent oxidoreductase [Chloroflexi bacterium]|nr:molybdopterin-dependent oxidoreductase [Chloroflexota bacterium]